MTYCIGIGNIASQKHHTADTFSEVIIGRCRKPDQFWIRKVTLIALEYVQYERLMLMLNFVYSYLPALSVFVGNLFTAIYQTELIS